MTTPGGSRMGPLSLRLPNEAVPHQRIKRGTIRRMLPYARPYRWQITLLLLTTILAACIAAASPLVLKLIIARGIAHRELSVGVGLSLALAGLALVLGAMFYLSWVVTVAALVMIPLFLIPGRKIGHRLQRLTRVVMEQDAEMSSMMTERFNISGALLTKLYGRVPEERELFAAKAGRRRDAGGTAVTWAHFLPIIVTLLTSFTTALVYGLGGRE